MPTLDELRTMIADTCYTLPNVGGLNVSIEDAMALDLDDLFAFAEHQSRIRREVVAAHRRAARRTT